MRKWGIVISVFYAAIVVVLLVPVGILLADDTGSLHQVFAIDLPASYGEWLTWVPIIAVLAGEAILLFLTVDTTQKRLKPRTHLAISVIAGSMLFAMLAFAVFSAVGAAIYSDKFIDRIWATEARVLAIWAGLWIVWGIIFFISIRDSTSVTKRMVSWLVKGSVLELLIAVPCHVIVRRRGDCSAPIATSFGIVTGIAVMLLSFGPSVLLLYKKRLDNYSVHKANESDRAGAGI
jgi:hypothetical protein